MDNKTHTLERLGHLDGLRGLAALIVVISHSANAGLLPSFLGRDFGQMGVALFYALSAFLLGRLYFRTEFSTAALRRYAVSRVARVLPLFYAALGAAAVIFLVSGKGFYDIDSARQIVLNALLVQGSSVLWSIPVELQYYLVFAGLWWLHARHGWTLGALIAAGLAIQVAVALTLWNAFPQSDTFNLAFWGHLFLFGLVLSQMQPTRLTGRAAPVQALLLLSILVLALPELRRMLGLPTLLNFVDPLTAGVPVLILYLAIRRAVPLRFLESGILRWLGGISFGVYLIHMPIITIVQTLELHLTQPAIGFVAVLTGSLFLSWVARHVIELPAQTLLRSRLTPAAVAATVTAQRSPLAPPRSPST